MAFFTKLSFSELKYHNIQFKFDEYGLLHIKFAYINGQVSGIIYTRIKYAAGNPQYMAKLSNISWEVTYAIESNKTSNGKYDVKFKSVAESEISYNIFRANIIRGPTQYQDNIKVVIKNLDFTPLKLHFKKISELILDTLKLKLK